MPKTRMVPTKREYQYDVAMCFAAGGRCADRFQSIDGRQDSRCSNCHIGHATKKAKALEKGG